jgi:hypothetical protein
VRQYSADQVKVGWTFTGDLTQGLAAGTFIQESRSGPTFRVKPDGMGGIVRMFSNNRSGTVTLLMDQESAQHQLLRTLANLDRITKVLVAPLVITDLNAAEITFYNQAFITTDPDLIKAVGPSTAPWVFAFRSVTHQAFQFNKNVVGS